MPETSAKPSRAVAPLARPTLTVIIPANNEADYIGACLAALIASEPGDGAQDWRNCPVEIIVIANGCTDDTAGVALQSAAAAEAKGWSLTVLDLRQGGKVIALNAGERVARAGSRVFIDADVLVSPGLLAQLAAVLGRPGPVYASGRPRVARAQSWVTRAYGRFWSALPFIVKGVPGCGVYAVNAPARLRWAAFPGIISDDTFVRLNFLPEERVGVAADYCFPLPEGFARLVKVRRRQDVGVREFQEIYPGLAARDRASAPGLRDLLPLLLRDPVGFGVYVAVALAVRLPGTGAGKEWVRGR